MRTLPLIPHQEGIHSSLRTAIQGPAKRLGATKHPGLTYDHGLDRGLIAQASPHSLEDVRLSEGQLRP